MKNWYFTYGTWSKFPYQRGWTKIEAPTREIAVKIFRHYHPDVNEGIVNCSDIYDEENFHKTEMWSKGNLGKHEVEIILMQRIEIPDTNEPW